MLSASTPPAKPAPFNDPFVAADGTIDLTSGWDDLDQQLAAATPSAEAATAFDDLLAELNVDGIQPFDVETRSPDDDAWQPFSMDDFSGQSVAEPVAASQAPVAAAAPT